MNTFVIDVFYGAHFVAQIKDDHELLIIKIIYGHFFN